MDEDIREFLATFNAWKKQMNDKVKYSAAHTLKCLYNCWHSSLKSKESRKFLP